MKFGKEFKSQMVPEWEEAYMNYDYLKTLLRDISQFRLKNKQPSPKGGLKRTLTMYRSFSGLTRSRRWSSLRSPSTMDDGGDIEDQVILIHHEGSEEGGGYSNNLNQYQTKFLMSSDTGGEYELVYFRRLDDELNKVNTFYRRKVEEVMAEAALLTKQMDALIAFRLKVENPDGLYHSDSDWNIEMAQLASDVAASTASATISPPARTPPTNSLPKTRSARGENNHERVRMDSIEEFDLIIEEHDSRNYTVAADTKPINPSNNSSIDGGETKPNKLKSSRPACVKILDRVTINNTLETPRSTIKGILKVNKNNELTYGRENLRKVEKKLKRAFIEFYQKLRLLKSYSFMNLLAFSKIMKKYDKIASRSASRAYLKMVDNSYLGNTDATARLMERVEAAFIKHFANSNRSKGIRILRPIAKRERHIISFSTGLFAGCAGALLVALILITRARNILNHKGSTQYMDNMFPLYSLFGFMVLHMLMYAMNIYAWRRYRVNYQFIFGFKHGTELGYREVFLLSVGLATLALASVLANLDMEMDPKTHNYKTFTELIPLALVGFIFVITICPLNIIYRSSRYFLLRCAYRCICAPFYKVLLPDFFLADQLTSQVQAIRSLEFYICYYGWGDFKLRQNTCTNGEAYKILYFIIATIPYWSRFLQCLRRLFEERDAMQGYNALKYLSTIVAVLMRTGYSRDRVTGWWVMAWVFSVIAACVSIYWDLVVDWGLLQRRSKNRWLRDKLLVSHKSVYAVAMVLNVLLRFAWLQTMLNIQVSFLHKEALTAIVASLEIIRRGMWNFFRLENEHLNNVGKYRAFKSVPLPFNYDEDEDKDE